MFFNFYLVMKQVVLIQFVKQGNLRKITHGTVVVHLFLTYPFQSVIHKDRGEVKIAKYVLGIVLGIILSAEKHLQDFNIHGNVNYSQPPSSTFKSLNGKHKNNEEIAKQLLLPTSEIEMWSNHLDNVKEARKSGAKKAAATRKAKKQQRGNSFLWFAFLFII